MKLKRIFGGLFILYLSIIFILTFSEAGATLKDNSGQLLLFMGILGALGLYYALSGIFPNVIHIKKSVSRSQRSNSKKTGKGQNLSKKIMKWAFPLTIRDG
jgi:hypothetical protein